MSGHGAYPAVMLDLPLHYQDISDLIFLQAVQNIDAVMQMDRQQSSLEVSLVSGTVYWFGAGLNWMFDMETCESSPGNQ